MRALMLARSAGFCYGVRRAVELAGEQAARGVPCVMLGSLIHNRDVTRRLAAQGLRVVDSPEEKASTSASFPCLSTDSRASAASPTLTALVVAIRPSRSLL